MLKIFEVSCEHCVEYADIYPGPGAVAVSRVPEGAGACLSEKFLKKVCRVYETFIPAPDTVAVWSGSLKGPQDVCLRNTKEAIIVDEQRTLIPALVPLLSVIEKGRDDLFKTNRSANL